MGFDTTLVSRKSFLASVLAGAGAVVLPAESRAKLIELQSKPELTVADIATAERIFGLEFSEDERKAILASVKQQSGGYEAIRKLEMPNSVAPAFVFVPEGKQPAPGTRNDMRYRAAGLKTSTDEDIAFLPVIDLQERLKKKEISSVELTKIYLARLERYGGPLLNVVTLLSDVALKQAKRADEERARGRVRGPLHGIPYGVKDLLAYPGYPTTFGAEPYEKQILGEPATVINKLEAAGAVLCAKLSLGALAMDDHWFKGKTKNPFNLEQGSSGSSAGSSSAMAAGLVAFTIGTETLGSIMSPSHRCRVTGLRPTFGRVSRHGAMALSWTMDKIGPICRTAQDCAAVLAAIHGRDAHDPTTVDRPLRFRPDLDLSKLKIGYLENDAALDEDDAGGLVGSHLDLLKSLGANPIPIKFTMPTNGIDTLLSVEASAAFEALTRTGEVNTIKNSLWPNIFRSHRFVPGVEYLQAMRARTLLMKKFEEELGDFDAIIASDRGSYLLFITNLTGHPQLYVPQGLTARGAQRGLSIIGRLYDEGTILGIGARIQQKTDYWQLRPKI